MKYKIIEAKTQGGLELQVNNHIKQGWTPQGSVQVQRYDYLGLGGLRAMRWSQAMVLKEKNDK